MPPCRVVRASIAESLVFAATCGVTFNERSSFVKLHAEHSAMDAQASTSVSSTEKCSSDNDGATALSARIAVNFPG
jgi:hypothetical protein